MKTYVPKKDAVERKWWLVDADGKILGRLAIGLEGLVRHLDPIRLLQL